jgi:AraC family transcriptional regulator of adaptative response / DNA-3-methyladenine glycosylase II
MAESTQSQERTPRSVAAVVTTGIYCRGCSAQPRLENVRRFAVAAAAEAAGYRACLRCRPYRVPQIGDWIAGPELVCRAVGLILDGALDGANEAELARRLGVSARHLRRLFVRHLGVTPGGLARSARVHYARRLLDDTDLSVLEIAYATGFGSVRQLNRACREIFQLSPRELRAKRRVTDRLAADGGLVLRLPFSGPLDWHGLLELLAADAVSGVESVSHGVYRRTIVVDGLPGALELFPRTESELHLRAHLPTWRDLMHIVQRVRRLAGLDFDPTEALRELSQDRALAALLESRPGLRPPGSWDAFETGVHAIVRQATDEAASRSVLARIVERFGRQVPGLAQLGLTHTFPAAEQLADAELDGLPSAQAATLRRFARAVVAGELRLDRSVSLDELLRSLACVEGLGTSTAHAIALRLGERDAFPIPREVVQQVLATDPLGSDPSERWRPWRALAATHIRLAAPTERRALHAA